MVVARTRLTIDLLPACSKILEHIVHQQVYKYFTDHSILENEQFGFKKGHSMSTCVLSLTNSIYLNMNSNMLMGVVFPDLKKAFDTTHMVFCEKNYKCMVWG